jgi:hypothetical protein
MDDFWWPFRWLNPVILLNSFVLPFYDRRDIVLHAANDN